MLATGVIIVITVLITASVGALVLFVFSRHQQGASTAGQDKATDILLQQIGELRRDVDMKLGESSRAMQDSIKTQLTESSKIVREVTQGLTKLDETNKQVISFADQLQSLQDVLKNPKQRGVLGEYYLESVLKNVLPPGRYQMQYPFKNGEIVDAVVFLEGKKVLPIDSKFSLENYNRIIESRDPVEKEKYEKIFKADLKKRIDETAKYIRPEEDTMDFAFMFIPSEGIYYDLLINQVGAVKANTRDLIEYAFQQKKVIIVSPTSFLAYLQTVMQGLKSLQIEEQAKDIQKRVADLGRHLGAYDQFMIKLGVSLGTTVNHYNVAHKELGKIDKDVVRIAGGVSNIDVKSLEKPSTEL
jgi:DNA recombination protein RmuC